MRTAGRLGRRLAGRLARREADAGQSLVEFALVIPMLLVLTLVALDFGRVYLGYINLQNMSRIAANYAANDPDAWGATPDTASQARYRNQILGDAAATNCDLPVSGGAPVVPAPAFADVNADGIGLGDTVTVRLTCTFGVITPVISSIVGGSVSVSASSSFPVKSGLSALAGGGGAGGGSLPVAPVAAFMANGVVSPDPVSNTSPFTVEFRDTSGGSPTSWLWTLGDGATSTQQDPLDHTFTCAEPVCVYPVTLTATNGAGSSTASTTVTVIGSTQVDFTASSQSGMAPFTVTFTDASTAGATDWTWSFGDGGVASGQTVTHTYSNAAGSPYTVRLSVTYPSPIGTQAVTKTGYITVGVGTCSVPSLNGVRFNDAPATWAGAGFTGSVVRGTGAPSGNFQITAQSLTATSLAPCNSSVTVNRP